MSFPVKIFGEDHHCYRIFPSLPGAPEILIYRHKCLCTGIRTKEMAQRSIHGFELDEAVVSCPECQSLFVKEILVSTPPLTADDVIEADLHRVFPDAEIRSSLLALCPSCQYCGWTGQFSGTAINPEILVKEPYLEPTKKYALAVKCARKKNLHALDIAFVALNGLWCAREAGEPDKLWLDLVALEHSQGMPENSKHPEEDGMAHLIMGEIWRQKEQFEKASAEYELALKDSSILPAVVQHQWGLSRKNISSVTALPLHVVRQMFDIQEATSSHTKPQDLPLVQPAIKESQKVYQNQAEDQDDVTSTKMLSAMATLLASQAEILTAAPADKEEPAGSSDELPVNEAEKDEVPAPEVSQQQHASQIEEVTQAPCETTAGAMSARPAPVAAVTEPLKDTTTAAQNQTESQKAKTAARQHGPMIEALLKAKSSHVRRYRRPYAASQVTDDGWMSDYNPPVERPEFAIDGEVAITKPVIGPNPNAVPKASSNPYGVAPVPAAAWDGNQYADTLTANQVAWMSENPARGDELPSIDIEDPFGELARRKKASQQPAAQARPAQKPAAAQSSSDQSQVPHLRPVEITQPQDMPNSQTKQGNTQQQPAAASQPTPADAIARVESYLSFSRALHTRSWMRGSN